MPLPSVPISALLASVPQDALDPHASTSLAPGSASESGPCLTEVEDGECVVCWAAGAEFLLQPCGHLCTCQACGRLLLSRGLACPMCRHPILNGMVISL